MSGRWITAKKGHKCTPPRLGVKVVTDLGRKPQEGDVWECDCGRRYRVRDDDRHGLEWSETGSFR